VKVPFLDEATAALAVMDAEKTGAFVTEVAKQASVPDIVMWITGAPAARS
jgi:ABC-type iron transport system FetAB ATPase subunit